MQSIELEENVLKVLLYFDMFQYPLTVDELYNFLPKNSITLSSFTEQLKNISQDTKSKVKEDKGYFFAENNFHYKAIRFEKEKYSQKHWKLARIMTHIIKRFPFVRAVFITGSLSKNSSNKLSDIDFMIVTQKNRLWVSRTLLMGFKKLFLLNKYKYFCINYSITEDNLEIEDKNIYTAIEVVTTKSTFNYNMLKEFINSNSWIKSFLPNYKFETSKLHISNFKVNNRKSYFQRIIEFCFPVIFTNKLDKYLQLKTNEYWKIKHANLSEKDREQMFRTKEGVSKVHPGNMQFKILDSYNCKLKEFNLI